MRRSTAPKTRRSPASETPVEPVSETRPIAAPAPDGAPSPRDQIRMGELADRYCDFRANEARAKKQATEIGAELLVLMKAVGRTSIPTAAGTVTFKKGTADRDVPDVDEMVKILEGLKIPIPTKKHAGSSEGLEFRLAR